MAILHQIVFACLLSSTFKLCAGKPTPNPNQVATLYRNLYDLLSETNNASKLMPEALRLAGVKTSSKCSLDTSLIYKTVQVKQNTLIGHLTHVGEILYPFLFASVDIVTVTDNGSDLEKVLLEARMYMGDALTSVGKVDKTIKFSPIVKYDSTKVDKHVKAYLKCLPMPNVTKSIRTLVRYAIFVKSLRLAMNSQNMQDNIRFFKPTSKRIPLMHA